jgi:phosphoribosylaminoimidazole-succinocarboxamide synthase
MVDTVTLEKQLAHALDRFEAPGRTVLRGKVRDRILCDDRLILITTDRVSAFDHILGTIPFKGEVLTEIAVDGFARTGDIVPNHLLERPDPNVMICESCKPYPVEVVVRQYITGSLWRDQQAGLAGRYGVKLPPDLRRDERLTNPILTPTTKAELGQHDAPISPDELIAGGYLSDAEWAAISSTALALFARGAERAETQGLLLVDTKYEFGKGQDGGLRLIDEVHTPDSSRYWIAESYRERFDAGQRQAMLDKENIRQWLIETQGYQGDGQPPPIPDQIRIMLAERYAALYEQLLGRPFEPEPGPVDQRIRANLRKAGYLP